MDMIKIEHDMIKIEQVVVGSEKRSTSAEIKSEPVVSPLQSCKKSYAIVHE